MSGKKTFYHWKDLPFKLDADCWGELSEATEKCPGVYNVIMSPKDGSIFGRDLYVVTRTATPSIISAEVIAYGIKAGNVWVYEYIGMESVYNLVEYEIMQYCVKHGLPIDEDAGTLYGAAVYNAEHFPWYYGGTIPPRITPFGLTTRVKKASEGLFFLETDQCCWVLAVSYPIWDS